MNRLLVVPLSMALLVALGLLACDNDEKPTGPSQSSPAGPATAHPPALVSPHSGPSQLPEPGDIALPGLLPGPSGSALPRPSLDLTDLEQATEVVWGSILGTEPSDPVVSGLLADVPVLMSGIRQIKGRIYLYLGIGREYYNRHGGEHIYNTLTKRFPTVPFYIEPSDGVQPLSASRGSQEEASPTDTLLADAFQAGLGAWTTTSTGTGIGWRAQAFDETPLPGAEAGNLVAVAQTEDCPENCALTLTVPLALSRYSSVTLSFDRWVDEALSAGEFLAVDLGNNGAYTRLDTWTDADGDSTWHHETYVIDAADLSSAVTVRFIAQPDNPLMNLFDSFFGGTGSPTPKKLAIDNVVIVPAPGAVILERNLTVESVSASPTAVASGGQVLLQVSIVNDGDAAGSQSIRVYRHTAKTTEPTAGTRVGGRATTGSLAAGVSVTKSIAVTASTVSVETTYFYYVCTADHCSETPAAVVVRPALEPAQGPNLTVASVTASPSSVASGDGVTVRATIRNDGNASVSSETVRVYQHRSATTDPTSGTLVGSATTGTLAAGASTTASVQITAPDVSTQRTLYYYACVEDTCVQAPATVTVSLKTVVTPVVDTIEIMGGSLLAAYHDAADHNYDTDITGHLYGAGTLTLGGLTTTDGTKGFVMSGHAVVKEKNFENLKRTDKLLFGDSWEELIAKDLLPIFIGKVARMPTPRKMGDFDNFFEADAAFVAYPSRATANCSLTWREERINTTWCLDLGKGQQVEKVTPLAIRGKNGATYNVVGSQDPTTGLEVMFTGSTSGVVEGNRVTNEAMLTGSMILEPDGPHGHGLQFSLIIGGGERSRGGDSGAPAYTVPDKDNNVHIVGTVKGRVIIADEEEVVVSIWSDVTKELDLQPISP